MKATNKLHCVLYRLRKKGLKIDTKIRTIYMSSPTPEKLKSTERLRTEFGFEIQLQIC